MLPAVLKRLKIQTSEVFPRWLHLLIPREKMLEMKRDKQRNRFGLNTTPEMDPGVSGLNATDSADITVTAFATPRDSAAQHAAVSLQFSEVIEDVPSQQTVLAEWGEKMRGATVYRKSAQIHAKEALDNGVLETIVDGDVETRKSYEKGDIIMCGTKGERYTTTILNFSVRYNRNAPGPAANPKLAEEGFQLYQAIGKIWAWPLTGEDVMNQFPAGEFTATWGEPVTVEEGDFLAMPFPDGGEVYRVKGDEFHDLYGVDLSLQGGSGRIPSQSEVMSLWSGILQRPDNTYLKTECLHAKVADRPGNCETKVKGVVEARKQYDKGDYIVIGSRGGMYPVSAMVRNATVRGSDIMLCCHPLDACQRVQEAIQSQQAATRVEYSA